MNKIEFPNLGLSFNINPVAFKIGNFEIYWYAIIIVLGIILGFSYAYFLCRKKGDDTEALYDVLLFGVPSAIVCARAYYVIFNFSSYKNDIWSIFNIHEGGIAIYGGVIGAALSTYIYAKVKKTDFLKLFDYGAAGLLVGQSVGRWGNFVNQEAFGGNYDGILSMTGTGIKQALTEMQKAGMNVSPEMGVHPTFLYESIWNLIGIILIYFIFKKKDRSGLPFAFYIGWYGIGRFIIEGLRTDSLMIGATGIRVSQVVAFISVCVSVFLFSFLLKKRRAEDE